LWQLRNWGKTYNEVTACLFRHPELRDRVPPQLQRWRKDLVTEWHEKYLAIRQGMRFLAKLGMTATGDVFIIRHPGDGRNLGCLGSSKTQVL
jgi:hypothetical protein